VRMQPLCSQAVTATRCCTRGRRSASPTRCSSTRAVIRRRDHAGDRSLARMQGGPHRRRCRELRRSRKDEERVLQDLYAVGPCGQSRPAWHAGSSRSSAEPGGLRIRPAPRTDPPPAPLPTETFCRRPIPPLWAYQCTPRRHILGTRASPGSPRAPSRGA